MEFLNLSHWEKSNGAKVRERGREREGYKGKTGEGVKGARKGKGVRKVKGAPNTMAHIQWNPTGWRDDRIRKAAGMSGRTVWGSEQDSR